MVDIALDSKLIVTNNFDEAVQELDILFNTSNTELIGKPRFGTNWYQFLWECTPSPEELKKYTYDTIAEFCTYASKFIIDINVDTMHDDNSAESIYVLTITLTLPSNNSIKRRKVYVLT